MDVAPTFEPGSGWVRLSGGVVPFSEESRHQYLAAAWAGYMLPLRRAGVRVLARDLLSQQPWHVSILCTEAQSWWNAQAHDPGDCFHAKSVLVDARLRKRAEHMRQYSGWQPQSGTGLFDLQTWLCGRTEVHIREVLEQMAVQESLTDPNEKHPRGITRAFPIR